MHINVCINIGTEIDIIYVHSTHTHKHTPFTVKLFNLMPLKSDLLLNIITKKHFVTRLKNNYFYHIRHPTS